MYIRKEGFPFIAPAFIIAILACFWTYWLGIPLLVVAIVVLAFFRDPERYPPSHADSCVLSPADGCIVVSRLAITDEIKEYNLPEGTHKLAIFLNVFNVHVNRSPIAGKVVSVTHTSGHKYPAFYEKSSILNEHVDVQIDGEKLTIHMRLIAGLVARRIVPWIKGGDTVKAAQRIAIIKFGSRADIYIPQGWAPIVSIGDTVLAGESILAVFEGE
jgi:phosphatidylserine decarboxylase